MLLLPLLLLPLLLLPLLLLCACRLLRVLLPGRHHPCWRRRRRQRRQRRQGSSACCLPTPACSCTRLAAFQSSRQRVIRFGAQLALQRKQLAAAAYGAQRSP